MAQTHMLHLWGRSSDAHNNVRIYLRVAIILGLLFALAGPFAKVAYAAEESPEGTPSPPDETSTEEISPPADEQNSSEEAVEIDEPVDTIGEETEPEKELAPDNSDAGADEADAGEADVGEASSEEPPEEGVQADEPDNDPVEESTAKISVPDPYFYVDGDKHSFLPEGGDCADAANCQVSTTPIQDALDAVSGGLTPDGNTIYIEGGIYEEDFSINDLSELTLQGTADDSPSILAGVVSVVDSFNIALRDLIFGEVILVRDSTDVTITGTDGDDEIEVELNGTVEAVSVEGGAGSDAITIHQGAESNDVHVGGGAGDDTLTLDFSAGTAENSTVYYDGGEDYDELNVIGDGESDGSYTPTENRPDAGVMTSGSNTINFVGIEPTTVTNQASYTFTTNGGNDSLQIDKPAAGQNRISGTSGGVAFEALTFSNITSFTIDTVTNGSDGNDDVTIDNDGLVATGLQNLTINTGSGGSDTVQNNGTIDLSGTLEITTGTINVVGDITADNGVTFSARNGVTLDNTIDTSGTEVSINADSDSDGSGTFTLNAVITTNNADATIEAADISIGTALGEKIDAGNNGYITLKPSTAGATIGIGTAATGDFNLNSSELTNGLDGSVLIIDGTGAVNIHTLNINDIHIIIRGGDVTFKGQLTQDSHHVEIFSNGRIIDGNSNNPDVQITGGSPWTLVLSSKNGVGTNGTTIDELETQVPWLVGEASAFAGFYLRNSGGLEIGFYTLSRLVEGITTNGGEIRITADSPLQVSRAIRENAGGDINLTAGNNSTQLGDDLTIEADVVVTGTTGKITGNAGDDIETKNATRVSAPGGVDFNSGLDGDDDNGGGAATVSGAVQATNAGAAITISGPNGVTITGTGQIITNGGDATLQAANGTVTQNGTIILNGGNLTVIEKPPDPAGGAAPGVTVTIDPETGAITITAPDEAAAAALALAANAVLTVQSGQPVSLLAAAALGSSVSLQLPEGDGATFITGINATVTMISGAEVILPAGLPTGFNMLASLEITVESDLTDDALGEILVSFGLPADTPIEELVILQYVEGEGWVEVPLEESLNGLVEGISESGGVFVLAQGSASASVDTGTGNGSAQASLSGNSGESVTLELDQGNQVTVTGGAGDAVSAANQGLDNLPGALPAGSAFLSGLAVDVTQGGAGVSILPNGEGIEVSFDLPDGMSPEDVVVLYWLDMLNGGQGGWQTLTPGITPDGRVTLQTFFDGTFVLANQSG
ncbi:MAG: hypothetical protein ISS57_15975 [Anaerolineales bacterium]|nr:hypothetical protein [Anaerolineales bacterium]